MTATPAWANRSWTTTSARPECVGMRRRKIVNNCYALQEQVARSRLTTTWRATALYSPNNFALTFLTFRYDSVPQQAFDEFARVFMALYRSQSPYLIAPFEYDESDGTKYLAAHWTQGESIGAALASGRIAAADQVINIAIHLLRGLSELERLGVQHNALDLDTVVMSATAARAGVVRLKDIGLSLFADALHSEPLPADRQVHERDLRDAGAIVHRLVTAREYGTDDAQRLAKLTQICDELQQAPTGFASIEAALQRVLAAYPEKRTVDLIKEHTVDVAQRDSYSSDLFQSIQARYDSTQQSMYEDDRAGRRRQSQRSDYDRRPASKRRVDEPSLRAQPQPQPQEEELIELLPVQEAEHAEPRGFFARALSALRRLFTRQRAAKPRGSQPTAPQPQPQPQDTPMPPEPQIAGFRGGSTGNDSDAPQPTYDRPRRKTDTGRIQALFQRLREHFVGVSRSAGPQLRYDVRPDRTKRSVDWRSVLRLSDRERFRRPQQGPALGRAAEATERGATSQRSAEAADTSGESGERWEIDRDAAAQAQDYDFQPGPQYAPGERRGLDDEAGTAPEVDFGSSSVRTDRDAQEQHAAAETVGPGEVPPVHNAGRRGEATHQVGPEASLDTIGGSDRQSAQRESIDGAEAESSDDNAGKHAGRTGQARLPDDAGRARSKRSRRQRKQLARRSDGRRSWLRRFLSWLRAIGRRVRHALIGPWS